ncbi:membrane protein [Microvirga vignae]|uniref:Membrane protein n=1 Tax=Microvirga vignae TaxID=1225564 RepID=A0A0H1R3X8_9HYPH|nr:ceramidase domain-containing protein [Microvirga vignae]KLK89516.1 membrane protein [Microvirga vignae]
MDPSWFQPIDSYCERIDASFWAEPVNAITNGFFLLAAAHALWVWRGQQPRDWPSLWLIAVTAIVGIGSFLFHTFANRWSLLADVLPIAAFIYSYSLLAMRRYLRLGTGVAIAITLVFAAFNVSFGRLWWGLFPGVTLNGSVSYLPALMAMFAVGTGCYRANAGQTGRALVRAGLAFALSLTFRSIDSAACSALPLGTHALWHMLNALVLWILMNTALAHAPDERPLHVPC